MKRSKISRKLMKKVRDYNDDADLGEGEKDGLHQ